MKALKIVWFVILSIFGLSLLLGVLAAIGSAIIFVGIIVAVVLVVGFTAFCLQKWWDSRFGPSE